MSRRVAPTLAPVITIYVETCMKKKYSYERDAVNRCNAPQVLRSTDKSLRGHSLSLVGGPENAAHNVHI